MGVPTTDFINQAIDEMEAVLAASSLFMSPDAASPPVGAAGPIVYVEANLPPVRQIPQYRLPHCGIVQLDHGPSDNDAAGETDYQVTIGLRLYHRGADRETIWRELQEASAAVARIVALEMTGGRFDGFATMARYLGGPAIDTEEEQGFGAMQLVRVAIDVTLPDY